MTGLDPNIIYGSASVILAATAAKFVIRELIGVVVLYKQLRFTVDYDYRLWWKIETSISKPRKPKAKRLGRKPVQRLEAVNKTDSKGGSARASRRHAG